MSITLDSALLLVKEHLHRPITGRLLLLGRQTIFLSIEDASRLVTEINGSIRSDAIFEVDDSTVSASGHKFISDRSFFSLFSDAAIDCLDVSAYEGAEIVHDLCKPIPENLDGQYDFIVNGSCLDNIFNASGALINMSRMLKKNGRVLIGENGAMNGFGEYSVFSPDWFYDFFVSNKYNDCKIYLMEYDIDKYGKYESPIYSIKDFCIYSWQPSYMNPRGIRRYEPSRLETRRKTSILVIAEKGMDSTDFEMPIQHAYRSQDLHEKYVEVAHSFLSSKRPTFNFGEIPINQEFQQGPGQNFSLCGFLESLDAKKYRSYL
ncbi:SAM-dependent methyltransferase [Azospirillum lipoferum]|uniref:Methyltransferase domain-containing protein n=1 Tax=Azospirillum lipoferum TaxID=193 RepID=A0A5A9GAV5_AZOLI|nr:MULTISPECIES: hypothetical protein [Azospirillum]KAA0590399.1 hypothetical protein FZ942_31620 [Azospirillum lipoferum]MCP1614816.1 SAM-dependent methyltransferase [Azospirillum lipoferum]MDW5532270.1 hypothetical protein [Azospirillum sp. NL1]